MHNVFKIYVFQTKKFTILVSPKVLQGSESRKVPPPYKQSVHKKKFPCSVYGQITIMYSYDTVVTINF